MKILHILLLYFALLAFNLRAHDQIVHQAITANAAEIAYGKSPAFENFINVISSDERLYKDATNRMVFGSFHEDDDPANIFNGGGGWRSLNHFYDPLDTSTYNKGLSDAPPDHRSWTVIGNNSFVWGSTSNCLGIDYDGAYLIKYFGKNVGTSNIWSWPNARDYEWLGLTATNQLERQTNLDNMFRAVGQVMHLLEDTSQPQHVHNE